MTKIGTVTVEGAVSYNPESCFGERAFINPIRSVEIRVFRCRVYASHRGGGDVKDTSVFGGGGLELDDKYHPGPPAVFLDLDENLIESQRLQFPEIGSRRVP